MADTTKDYAALLRDVAEDYEFGLVEDLTSECGAKAGRLRALADQIEQGQHVACMCDDCSRARWRGDI